MPDEIRSPLTSADMDQLTLIAAKSNRHGLRHGHAPLYLAVDAGDATQPDGYLFLCWPALNLNSARAAQRIFDHIAYVVEDTFGSRMVATLVDVDDDAPAS